MRKIVFSDGFEFEIKPFSEVDYSQYKYRLNELFHKLTTPSEAKYYRKRLIEYGLNISNVNFWSKIKADAPTSIPGDALEKLSDALDIPMRDLKYKD